MSCSNTCTTCSPKISHCHSTIPLGSCTMILNATAEMMPVTFPNFANLHPFAPVDQTQGFDSFSLQPKASAAGEYLGLMVIRAYHRSRGDSHRNVCIIPVLAHGTNPASAAMYGMKIVAVGTDSQGNINIEELRKDAEANKDNLAALMDLMTCIAHLSAESLLHREFNLDVFFNLLYPKNPSTHGVYEEDILIEDMEMNQDLHKVMLEEIED